MTIFFDITTFLFLFKGFHDIDPRSLLLLHLQLVPDGI